VAILTIAGHFLNSLLMLPSLHVAGNSQAVFIKMSETQHRTARCHTALFVFLQSESGFTMLAFFSQLDEERFLSC